jgi:retron-type reverse transcriptase
MKRYGNLWPQITSFENLLNAARQAQRGKRYRGNVLAFNHNLEAELFRLQRELTTFTYQPGPYRGFRIFEPKPRLISAAPYRDRIVHHALCNVIVPPLERTFIPTSYANRKGYGTHRALQQFTALARSHRYVLQCDIRKYFPSIDHEILKSIVQRKIKCPETLWLLDCIIDSSNPQEPMNEYFPGDTLFTPYDRRRGLPIGNLTSQFLANCYLNRVDHFVIDRLRISDYVRYVDDFALFSDDRAQLVAARVAIESQLAQLRLRVHPIKSQLSETRIGASFVGFRVLPDRIRIRNDSIRRSRQRLKKLRFCCAEGLLESDRGVRSFSSWMAHLDHGDTWRLQQCLRAAYPEFVVN